MSDMGANGFLYKGSTVMGNLFYLGIFYLGIFFIYRIFYGVNLMLWVYIFISLTNQGDATSNQLSWIKPGKRH